MTGRIDLFNQLKEFDYLCVTGLPGMTGNYRSVYFALLSINNSKYWAQVFDVDFQYILDLSKVDKDTYRRAMDYLNENGLFDSYVKGINKWARAQVSLKVLTEKPTGSAVGNTGSNTTSNAVSTAHLNKTENNKTLNKKNSVAFTPPDFFLVFSFFKEKSAAKNWTERFCEIKANAFIAKYDSDWDQLKKDGWQSKIKYWIATEKNPETTTDLANKLSDGRIIPDEPSKQFHHSLINEEDRVKTFAKWRGKGYKYIHSGKESEIGWHKIENLHVNNSLITTQIPLTN